MTCVLQERVLNLVDVSDLFCFFLFWGGGKGGGVRGGGRGGGGRLLIKIEGGGGGVQGGGAGGGRAPGECLWAGGVELNLFFCFRGRNPTKQKEECYSSNLSEQTHTHTQSLAVALWAR